MRIRCIGGPLDDTEVEVPDPPPWHLQALWPVAPLHALDIQVGPMPSGVLRPIATYQLENWTDPFGEQQVRYVCPQRADPRGAFAPGYEPPRPPPPSWEELIAERDRLVAEFGDPRDDTDPTRT